MSTTAKFALIRDINGYNGFGLQFSSIKYSATLAQNTDTSLTVPTGASMGGVTSNTIPQWLAIFSYEPSTATWIALNQTAASPAGASFASTTSELNPVARVVQAGDVLHFFSTGTATDVGVVFYSLS